MTPAHELTRAETIDRAMGALVGGALGDALGMPTQLLSPAEIRAAYGHVEGFVAPIADHPVSKGMAAGTITDDTEQALLLGRILAESDPFDHRRWVNALLDWEREVKARGSYDLLGPSTKRAIDAINAGVPPDEAGRNGNTNGAAMRIGPVGIRMPVEPLDALVAKVAETCRATHNTGLAIASAGAVAAAISHGIAGGDWEDVFEVAIEAARLGEAHGTWSPSGSIAARIAWIVEMVRGKDLRDATKLVTELVGTSVAAQESVPAAFAVLQMAGGDPWEAAVIAANLGGDTDTIGAIAAGMAGACAGFGALPQDKVAALQGINIDDVRTLAENLVDLRLGRTDAAGGDA